MKKVLIAILLTTCLILSSVSFFASCVSRQNDDSGTTEGDTTEEDTTEEVTTAPVPEAKEAELMGDFVPSETYKGVVSEETFQSPADAAKAFMEDELSGEEIEVTFESYEKKADLSEEEIKKLPLSAEQLANVISAEEGVVNYKREIMDSDGGNEPIADETFVCKFYVVVFSENGKHVYRYISPELSQGDDLTKSYFDSVQDPAKFANSTNTQHGEYKSVVDSSLGYKTTIEEMNDDIFKFTETAAYWYGTGTNTKNGVTKQQTFYTYDERINGCVYSWMKEGEEDWVYIGSEDSGDVMGGVELTTFDSACFEKTATGFKMKDEFFIKVIVSQYTASFEQMNYQVSNVKVEKSDIYYYVADGYATKSVMDFSFSFEVENGTEKATVSIFNTSICDTTDFGTTVIARPEGLPEAN